MYKLQTNIMTLKQGGTISGINLKSLPSDFLDLSDVLTKIGVFSKRILLIIY